MEFDEAKEEFIAQYKDFAGHFLGETDDGLEFESVVDQHVKIFIHRDEIEDYIKNQLKIKSDFKVLDTNCGILSKNYREQLVNVKMRSLNGIFDSDKEENYDLDPQYYVGDPTGTDPYVEISQASSQFIDFVRFDEYYKKRSSNKIIRKLNIFNKMGRKREVEFLSDLLYKPLTIKVNRLNSTCIDDAFEKSSNLIGASFFAFAKDKQIAFGLIDEWPKSSSSVDPLDFMPRSSEIILALPSGHFCPDLVRIYQRGTSAEDPFIQFLSYYHVLEYCFIPSLNEKLIKDLTPMINEGSSEENVIKILKTFKKCKYNELDKLKILLETFISRPSLLEFITDFEIHMGNNLYTRLGNAFDGTAIGTDDELFNYAANRIYKTRCALVHYSDSQENKSKYLPDTRNEAMLRNEIPLANFIATQIILNFSNNCHSEAAWKEIL